MARADKYSLEQKKVTVYSDFSTNMEKNPFTGYLFQKTNEEAVKQSLKTLMLTDQGERFYDSNKGSRIKYSLFELANDPDNEETLKMLIAEAAANYEPRARINKILVENYEEQNLLSVTIIFSIINIPDKEFILNLAIDRVR